MNQDLMNLRERLIKEAKARRTVYYSDIAWIVHLDMNRPPDRIAIASVLEEICRYEHVDNRPMLSAIVIGKRKKAPGQGFYKLGQDLDQFSGGDEEAARAFYRREREHVWDYWSRHL